MSSPADRSLTDQFEVCHDVVHRSSDASDVVVRAYEKKAWSLNVIDLASLVDPVRGNARGQVARPIEGEQRGVRPAEQVEDAGAGGQPGIRGPVAGQEDVAGAVVNLDSLNIDSR
jgi:hypothetical protein